MLNEPSVLSSSREAGEVPPAPAITVQPPRASFPELESAVQEVMDVYKVSYDPPAPAHVAFTGRLRVDSETAYARLDDAFAAQDYHTLLTTDEQNQHVVLAIKGRIRPRPRPWWPNALLLVLTFFSLLYIGALQQASIDGQTEVTLWEGLPYALSLLLILGTHELGHFFAARHHKVNVTLPYFIPMPLFFFGTLGAFIQLREPMRNRKMLFDIGAAGPLAGLVIAIPVLLIGLATSPVEPFPNEAYIIEGDSLLYAGAKTLVYGRYLPSGGEDVFINQLAKAGWTGLFITGLNLIPLGQLDGGHVIFTLLGRRAQRLYLPLIALFLMLSVFNSSWLLWTMLLFFLGRVYATPMDTVTPLDLRRRALGWATLAIFVLVFVPNPLNIVQP